MDPLNYSLPPFQRSKMSYVWNTIFTGKQSNREYSVKRKKGKKKPAATHMHAHEVKITERRTTFNGPCQYQYLLLPKFLQMAWHHKPRVIFFFQELNHTTSMAGGRDNKHTRLVQFHVSKQGCGTNAEWNWPCHPRVGSMVTSPSLVISIIGGESTTGRAAHLFWIRSTHTTLWRPLNPELEWPVLVESILSSVFDQCR